MCSDLPCFVSILYFLLCGLVLRSGLPFFVIPVVPINLVLTSPVFSQYLEERTI